jgi:hypothetical protein
MRPDEETTPPVGIYHPYSILIREPTETSVGARLLGGRVLGDGLGALGDGVLGKLSGEDEADGGLDLAGRDGRAVVVRGELGSLGSDTLEDVRDERVEDGHGLVTTGESDMHWDRSVNAPSHSRDTGVGVDLLEDLVDVRGVGLDPLLRLLLATLLDGGGLRGLGGSLGGGGGGLGGLRGGGLGSDGGLRGLRGISGVRKYDDGDEVW